MQFLIPQFKFTARTFEELQRQLEKMYDDIYREISLKSGYVDRGDLTGYDYDLAALTTDSTWRDLDLSSIVPVGASAVLLKCVFQDNVVGSAIAFRENGNTNIYNTLVGATQSTSIYNVIQGIVSVDSSRIIEYSADNVTWTSIYILVRGWFI